MSKAIDILETEYNASMGMSPERASLHDPGELINPEHGPPRQCDMKTSVVTNWGKILQIHILLQDIAFPKRIKFGDTHITKEKYLGNRRRPDACKKTI